MATNVDQADLAHVRQTLNNYITDRDRFHQGNNSLSVINPNGLSGLKAWDELITAYHQVLFGELGQYNLAMLEALSELVGARLNYIRMNIRP